MAVPRRQQSWYEQRTRFTPEIVRQRIRTAAMLNRLQNCALGRITLTNQQIAAAKILLDKTLPNLSSTEVTRKPFDDMSDAQLIELLTNVSRMIASQAMLEKQVDLLPPPAVQ